jgi:two-component system sensor histidine kinase YesM
MNAIAHDDESTAELSFLLAEFMHTLIEGRDARVPLSRELELLRGYLAFINIRYEGRILWNIDAAPELSEAPVLCLMIQPVVENAVIHGIQPAGKGRIDIRIFREHENLVIAIGDDGTGMDGEALAKLEARLGRETGGAEDAEAGDSIGLKNVHDRLRYTFGSPYGISINSAPGKGTTIVMLLPLTAPGER